MILMICYLQQEYIVIVHKVIRSANTIEAELSQLINFSNNFSGINGKFIKKLSIEGNNIDKYFNNWINSSFLVTRK